MIPQQLIGNFRRELYLRKRNNIGKYGPSKKEKLEDRSLADEDDVIQSLFDIYYHPNTLWAHVKGAGKHAITDRPPYRSGVDALLNGLGQKIFEYLNSPTPSGSAFDSFHEGLCDDFLLQINAIRSKAGLPDMNYGQAQKLINLTFKYLACYKDYWGFKTKFIPCHMVIDRKVLSKLENGEKLGNIFGFKTKWPVSCIKGGRVNGHPWTRFEEKDYKDLRKDYLTVIGSVAKASTGPAFTPLEIEFQLWP